jgi:hypothetical protein
MRCCSYSLAAAGPGARGAGRRAGEHPLVPLTIFRNRNVSGANAVTAAVFAGNLGMFFLITLYLQLVEHYSPIGTGLGIRSRRR